MKKIFNIIILLLVYGFTYSQSTIKGTFSGHANKKIKLFGFSDFNTYTIDSVIANNKGVFCLSYSKKDYGMGYLYVEDKPFFVVLSGENLKFSGESFALPATIKTLEGKENQIFAQYAIEHPQREQVLSAWEYLEKIYRNDSIFSIQKVPVKAIANEKQRIKAEDSSFLAGLDKKMYVRWYLSRRKLTSSVSTIAQYRTQEIPSAIASFRKIDYTDPRLYKSGLLKEVIESHFWLIENSGLSLDSVYIEMNISIDQIIENLLPDEQKLNEITQYLFKFLEKHSLFGASEYLALKLLNEQSCTINNYFASQLESYRAMKKGNTAPDFKFKSEVFTPGFAANKTPKKMSDLQSKYKVVLFGASWCPQCTKELSQISDLYQKWKSNGIEVIFVSLDESKEQFINFTKAFPYISICDYSKWESPIVKSYHVFATPTIYLLNNRHEILLRPNNVRHLDSWVEWYLVQGNK